MSKESTLLLLGIGIVLTQFSGLPSSWKNVLFFICGGAVAVLGFLLRRRMLAASSSGREERTNSYVQNGITGTTSSDR
ncbi:MAG TPA: hypothetical protein VJI74_00835 [Candidatus Paceibacterota bacterium]